MFQIDLKNKKTISAQVTDGIKSVILSGEYGPDDRLPSVRDLSASLTVNPNTIQKAYAGLEQDGWIYIVSGRGAFVSGKKHEPDPEQLEALYAKLRETVDQIRFLGEKKEALSARVRAILEENFPGTEKESRDAAEESLSGTEKKDRDAAEESLPGTEEKGIAAENENPADAEKKTGSSACTEEGRKTI